MSGPAVQTRNWVNTHSLDRARVTFGALHTHIRQPVAFKHVEVPLSYFGDRVCHLDGVQLNIHPRKQALNTRTRADKRAYVSMVTHREGREGRKDEGKVNQCTVGSPSAADDSIVDSVREYVMLADMEGATFSFPD